MCGVFPIPAQVSLFVTTLRVFDNSAPIFNPFEQKYSSSTACVFTSQHFDTILPASPLLGILRRKYLFLLHKLGAIYIMLIHKAKYQVAS